MKAFQTCLFGKCGDKVTAEDATVMNSVEFKEVNLNQIFITIKIF